LVTVIVAVATFALYHYWSGLSIDVGEQASPQEVFFGTEYRNPDVAQFVVPIEVLAAVFFVLIALMFVGLGQVLGRAFDAYPNRVMGYTLNISGSLAGIVGFSAISFIQAPPVAWFFISCGGIAYLLHQVGALTSGTNHTLGARFGGRLATQKHHVKNRFSGPASGQGFGARGRQSAVITKLKLDELSLWTRLATLSDI